MGFRIKLVKKSIWKSCLRRYSSNFLLKKLEHSDVIFSKSEDIFTNLAFEDWLFKFSKLSAERRILLFWRNNPCVVIGRHQNPWSECNWQKLGSNGILLARRNSGGGTVYHDLQNLNICFMSHKNLYNRRNNLELLCRSLRNNWTIDCKISPREDIVVNNKKVSGTASRLSQNASYHHCTLLIDVDAENLHGNLTKNNEHIQCNATKSVRSEITNLKSQIPEITVDRVIDGILKEYSRTYQVSSEILYIDPSKLDLNDFNKMRKDLQSWEWVYGKTPKFSVSKKFDFENQEIKIKVHLFRGLITKIDCTPQIFDLDVLARLEGVRYVESRILDVFENCKFKLDRNLRNSLESILIEIIKTT